ncbi:uncharacterized protein Tco025E_01943, partial [Trypanosoma conorhini]
MMQGKMVLPLLLALLALAATLPAPALATPSEHIIAFNGSAWGPVVEERKAALEAAIVSDVDAVLKRTFVFDTNTTVNSLAASGGLEVRVTVQQTLLPDAPTPKLQNHWGPEEVNSMITRSGFPATLALYPGPGKAVLVSAYVPGNGRTIFVVHGHLHVHDRHG